MPLRIGLPLVFLMLLALLSCGTDVSSELHDRASCKTQRIKDGDSVLALCDGNALELRLECIDAPELTQKTTRAI